MGFWIAASAFGLLAMTCSAVARERATASPTNSRRRSCPDVLQSRAHYDILLQLIAMARALFYRPK